MSAELKQLPRAGRPAAELLDVMRQARTADVNWREGKVWSLVFHAGEALSELLKHAYTMFFSENALNPTAFPSLQRFEAEVVAMTASLLGAGPQAVGNMTSGGTESILMAVKTAREWGRARGVKRPQMLLPTTAHPAFDKAAHYFGVDAVHVPVGPDFRADLKATRRAITRRTVLLVGSAPSYPQGVVDPIEPLAALAAKKHLLCHVDACVGGFMLPFVRDLGHDVPPFDLSVPGVTSLSVDLHKYAYAAKGASVILYNDPALRRHQYFACTDWPGGIYASPTMTGTRPGGAIAAAWAIMSHLGFDGYRAIAAEVMDATLRLRLGIDAIDGVEVLGDPHMSILAIGSRDLDIYEVADHMSARGWHLDRQQFPPSLHVTINRAHVESADAFLLDLKAAATAARRRPLARLARRVGYGTLGRVVKSLPAPLVSRMTRAATALMGLGDGALPERSAPMYGMMAALPNRGDLQTVVIDLLDQMTRPSQAD